MRKTFYLLFPLLCLAFLSNAQKYLYSGENYYDDQTGIIYNRELTIDLKFHTHGFALGTQIGQINTYYLTRFLNFEIGELKHIKEYRQSDFQTASMGKVSRAFIFGKQNSFFVLRGGVGEKRYFSEKAKRKGLAIGMSYEAGPSLGILKPYYLELIRTAEPGSGDYRIVSEKYTSENANDFTNLGLIYGASGFAKGLDEVSIMPGGHAKMALHFDWGAFDEFVKALEAGVMVDLYFKKVPIMVETATGDIENSPLFVNLYINLQLGKRW
ncbi:MAG: hypothetical protein R2824_09950 [Saprospiraceae bacterium]